MHHPCLLHVIDHGLTRLPSLGRLDRAIVRLRPHRDHIVTSLLNQVPVPDNSLLAILCIVHVILLAQSGFV